MLFAGMVNTDGPAALCATVPLWAALGGFHAPYCPQDQMPPGGNPERFAVPFPTPGQFGGASVPAPRLSVDGGFMSEANFQGGPLSVGMF